MYVFLLPVLYCQVKVCQIAKETNCCSLLLFQLINFAIRNITTMLVYMKNITIFLNG